MKRKRVTQLFPFLIPVRKTQRKLFFYIKMYFDRNHYAKAKSPEFLPYSIYETKSKLLNENTGFDMKYQENKVFNLRLAAEPVNGLIIRPGETFSFWQVVRYAERNERYKYGLCVVNDELITVPGGGLCHLSNLLFWVFLHVPLTIVERHPHGIKDFPSPDEDEPDSVDATINEGWLDLKVRNNTSLTFQIEISFDESFIYGRIFVDQAEGYSYEVINRDKSFFKKGGKTFERVSVCRQVIDNKSQQVISENLLYTDIFEIGYALPEGTVIEGEEDGYDD
ncbi:putative vancomycin resistance protein [Desulfitobacterium dichloroeliminans LMG P-21439]|uniref:Putative vancomycin resistance protein n=1 Tax=Desulfitobacterium dichloroeliminans (strain LMG P-21439 / DCA1) TaxID=871963 RepID=L0F705_DESDL|nr:glycopeptide resistance accessory protein VanW [Desulfitobacterium dichloroeliminans]AGA68967.1 putative vancomycin resistance protein [Desulfitobacterium dichloroeliminans LMG P-21439]